MMLMNNFVIFCSFQLFLVGVFGVLSTQKNILFMLMSIEISILAVNLFLISSSILFSDLVGQVFALMILTVVAAESAVGLSFFILLYKKQGTIMYPILNLIKG
jgi:NADH-quinone oxidoreductase subunit K